MEPMTIEKVLERFCGYAPGEQPRTAELLAEMAELRSKASEYDATIARLNDLWAENERLRAESFPEAGTVDSLPPWWLQAG